MGKSSGRKNRHDLDHPPSPELQTLRPWWDSTALHLLIVALLGVLVYANTFQVPFVFDDDASIVRNPVIRNLREFLAGAGYAYNPRRFIGYLTFALNYRLGGVEVTGYHLFNLVVHIVSAGLVYALVRTTCRMPYFTEQPGASEPDRTGFIALLAALLFVGHPVQTQAVTYVVQRLASLATLFYLLALLCYARGRLSGSPAALAVAFVAAVLAMHTKEIAFTLPLVVMLYEVLFFKGRVFRNRLFLLPLVLLLSVIPLQLLRGGSSALLADVSNLTRVQSPLPRLDYLLTQFRVMVTYLRLLVLPVQQNLDYDYPVYHSLLQLPVICSLLLLLALFGLALHLAWKPRHISHRLIAFGIFWFFITLAVESSVIPIADVIFEHRLYLPMAGASIAAAATLLLLASRAPAGALVLGCGLIVLALGGATWKRNQVWQESVTLWDDVVRKSPRKDLPRTNLGKALYQQGRTDAALEQLRIALQLNPGNAIAHGNLGAALLDKGAVDEALAEFRRGLVLKPTWVTGHFNLGLALIKKGLTDQAIHELRQTVELDPDHVEARYHLAVIFMSRGESRLALEQAGRVIAIQPGHARGHYLVGLALRQQGRKDEAIAAYQRAVALDPGFRDAYNDLGVTLAESGQADGAIESFQRAIELGPEVADYHDNLGRAYALKGLRDKAEAERDKAAALRRR
jgi:tetratricopeptide (TPR) repeat protein